MNISISIATMPKVKHGRRQNHYRVKNSERRSLVKKSPEGTPLAQLPTESANIPTAQDLFTYLSSATSSPLKNWHFYKGPECVELSLLHNSPPQPSVVKFTLTLYKNLYWVVRLYGKLLTNQLFLEKFPHRITSFEELKSICDSLGTINVCVGNDDVSFVQLVENRGGLIMNKSSVVAFVDKTPRCTTVRHITCQLVCVDGHQRCSACLQYRPTLRAMREETPL